MHILLQKNNLKLGLEEQHAIDQISSPKRLLLDYYKKGKYIAVKYNVWKVEKNHISNEIMKNIGSDQGQTLEVMDSHLILPTLVNPTKGVFRGTSSQPKIYS